MPNLYIKANDCFSAAFLYIKESHRSLAAFLYIKEYHPHSPSNRATFCSKHFQVLRDRSNFMGLLFSLSLPLPHTPNNRCLPQYYDRAMLERSGSRIAQIGLSTFTESRRLLQNTCKDSVMAFIRETNSPPHRMRWFTLSHGI